MLALHGPAVGEHFCTLGLGCTLTLQGYGIPDSQIRLAERCNGPAVGKFVNGAWPLAPSAAGNALSSRTFASPSSDSHARPRPSRDAALTPRGGACRGQPL